MVDPGHQIIFYQYLLSLVSSDRSHQQAQKAWYLLDWWDGSSEDSPVWQTWRQMWGQPQKHKFQGPCCWTQAREGAVNLLPTLPPHSPEQKMVDHKSGCLRYTPCKPLKCYDHPRNALHRKGNGACHPSKPMRCQQGLIYTGLDHGLHNSVSPLSMHSQGQLHFISAQQWAHTKLYYPSLKFNPWSPWWFPRLL